MRKEKLYKLYRNFPPMTKFEWISLANRLWQELYIMRLEGLENNYMYKDSARLLIRIYKKFNVKTI